MADGSQCTDVLGLSSGESRLMCGPKSSAGLLSSPELQLPVEGNGTPSHCLLSLSCLALPIPSILLSSPIELSAPQPLAEALLLEVLLLPNLLQVIFCVKLKKRKKKTKQNTSNYGKRRDFNKHPMEKIPGCFTILETLRGCSDDSQCTHSF